MSTLTLLPLHVVGGAIGIVSGLLALYVRKGGRLHRRSGTLFFYAILVMALSGAVIAVGRAGAAINIPAALVTTYLVITSMLTVRPSSAATRRMERGAMWAAFAVGAGSLLVAASGSVGGPMAYPLVMFGLLALLSGMGDRRMIRAGGLQGTLRIKRHLWRMSAALFIAAGSFFLGPVRRIPEPLRIPALRLIPFVVLVTMVYWLWRYRQTRNSVGVVGCQRTMRNPVGGAGGGGVADRGP